MTGTGTTAWWAGASHEGAGSILGTPCMGQRRSGQLRLPRVPFNPRRLPYPLRPGADADAHPRVHPLDLHPVRRLPRHAPRRWVGGGGDPQGHTGVVAPTHPPTHAPPTHTHTTHTPNPTQPMSLQCSASAWRAARSPPPPAPTTRTGWSKWSSIFEGEGGAPACTTNPLQCGCLACTTSPPRSALLHSSTAPPGSIVTIS